jgi:hypothetical protein
MQSQAQNTNMQQLLLPNDAKQPRESDVFLSKLSKVTAMFLPNKQIPFCVSTIFTAAPRALFQYL